MDVQQIEVVAQAYMVYEQAILLLKITSTRNDKGYIWRPIGGKTTKRSSYSHARGTQILHPEGLLRPQIAAYRANYTLFEIGGSLLYNYDIQNSPNNNHFDITLAHYGVFLQPPGLESRNVQLFTQTALEELLQQGTVEEYVCRWSKQAFSLAQMFSHPN